jgi:hypothetical protein
MGEKSGSFPIETSFPNGVRVVTCRRSQRAFESAAIFRGKLLNLLSAEDPIHAERLHELLASTWGSASESNLLDESEGAPWQRDASP